MYTTTTRSKLWWRWFVFHSCTSIISALPPSTSISTVAKSMIPLPVVYPASCAAAGTWYLQGGYHLQYTNAAYSLDLTMPWNTTAAPWIQLPASPNISTSACIISINGTYSFQGISGSSSDTVLSFFGNENIAQPFMTLFDVSSQTWIQNSSSNTVAVPARSHDQIPVGNPQDGLVYTRGGYQSQNGSTMDVYSSITNTFKSLSIPTSPGPSGGNPSSGGSVIPISQGYSVIFCSQRNSILYFGGRDAAAYVSPSIYEYFPANNSWAVLRTMGKGPTAREDACMATDQSCSKLVIFAGQDMDSIFADIYVLDLTSMQWTTGSASTDSRLGMSCTMFDDAFLVWGGASDSFLTNLYGSWPALFNVSTMRWSTGYKMADLAPLPTLTPINTKRSITLVLALGLVMGAVGLAAVSGGLLLYRQERKKTMKQYGRIHGLPYKLGRVSNHGHDSQSIAAQSSKGPKVRSVKADQKRTEEYFESSKSTSRRSDNDNHDAIEPSLRRKWENSLGHKIEQTRQGSDELDIISQNKQEDPTFIPQAQPTVGLIPAPMTQSGATLPWTLSALPPGLPAPAPAVIPLARPQDTPPSAPTALYSREGINDAVGQASTSWPVPQSPPYNPDFSQSKRL